MLRMIAKEPEDHRVRVGRQKRERMRAHLLKSVFSVCSRETLRDPASIDDVVKDASVSRGTFYKYFDSLDEAISELGLQMADEMVTSMLSVYDVLDEPVMRTATGFQMFLLRAAIDRRWGSVIGSIWLLNSDNFFSKKIKQDIRLGVDTGDYVVVSIDVAADLLMGAKLEAIRRIIGGSADSKYIRTMTAMVLRGFGVSPSRAEKCVQKAYDRLTLEAPKHSIFWWRSID